MNRADSHMNDLLGRILSRGSRVPGRNGYTLRTLLYSCRFEDFPLVSLRKVFWKGALREMEWFLSGSSNINDLDESVRHWWAPWAARDGQVLFNYSKQLREFDGHRGQVDQVKYLLRGIREHPFSRRNVITTWNTRDMVEEDCPITNCHGTVIQCFVEPDDTLHLKMYQRSVDVMLGMTHNWVQYWALLQWLAYRTGRRVGSFHWEGGDCHVYDSHTDEARKVCCAYDTSFGKMSPALSLKYTPSDEDFLARDFEVVGDYTPLTDARLEMVV